MINWNRRKYTEEQFKKAWLESPSICACARTLGLNVFGSTYTTMKNTAKELGLDQSHMTGQGHLKGKTHNFNTRPLEEVLVYGKHENSYLLKNRLFRDGIKERKCEVQDCGITHWLGKPAPLALDHIDGDRLNHCIENLRILCYNCHGQTETFCKRK